MSIEKPKKPTSIEFTQPDNYQPMPEDEYPRYTVRSVYGGGAHEPAKSSGPEFSFKTSGEAKAFIEDQIKSGFGGTIEVTRWDSKGEGGVLIQNMHVELYGEEKVEKELEELNDNK